MSLKRRATWIRIKRKLKELEALDKALSIFGASTHRYSLNPAITLRQMEQVERIWAVKLPEELKEFYLQMGNGGAGPAYGIWPLESLQRYQPEKCYQGIVELRRIAERESELYEDGYFEMIHDMLQGVVSIIPEGCGHQIGLICNGPGSGKVVYLSSNGHLQESSWTFLQLYENWLDHSLASLSI